MAHLKLAEVMTKKKISKRQFAKRLGVHYNTIFRYFRPGYDPKLSSLAKWAGALDVRIRDLIEE